MREFFINELKTTWRVKLLNFSDPLADRFPFPPHEDHRADLEIKYYCDEKGFIADRVKKGRLKRLVREDDEYRKSYLMLSNERAGSVFCIFEKGLPFSHVLVHGISTAFLTFQDRLNVVFLHSSVVVIDGKAYLFVAPGGGGKSTIYALAREKGFEGIDDDSCVVKRSGDRYYAQIYPFHFLPGWSGGEKEIGGVFFLEKSDVNRVEGVSRIEALRRALPETEGLFNMPVPRERFKSHRGHVFGFLDSMLDKVGFSLLHFKKDPEVFSCLMKT